MFHSPFALLLETLSELHVPANAMSPEKQALDVRTTKDATLPLSQR